MVRATAAAVLCFAVPSVAAAAEPPPPQIDEAAIAEKKEIRAKGKRLLIGAWVCTGTMLSLTATSMVLWYGFEHTTGTLVTAGTGLALAGVAIPLAVAGGRRIQQPERFMKQRHAAIAPSLSRRHIGATFSLRF